MKNTLDEQVFEAVFKNSFARLYAYAFNLLKEREAAREAVQQVFVKTWQTYQGRSEEEQLLRYLYKAVHNTAVNQLRAQKRKAVWQQDQAADTSYLRPAETAEKREIQQIVADTFRTLPDRAALVFHLNRQEGLKYSEIALKLGISQKAVEKHMSNALKLFRVKLKDYLVVVVLMCKTLLKLL